MSRKSLIAILLPAIIFLTVILYGWNVLAGVLATVAIIDLSIAMYQQW